MASDKIEHKLWEVYKRELPKELSKIVELGVYKGDSLRLLRVKYPEALIVGVDILPKPDNLGGFEYHQLDQTDPRLVEICENADVIIDDCSHIPELTLKSFDLLFYHLKKGALYFIEDWTPWIMPEAALIIDIIESSGIKTQRFINKEVGSSVAKFTR